MYHWECQSSVCARPAVQCHGGLWGKCLAPSCAPPGDGGGRGVAAYLITAQVTSVLPAWLLGSPDHLPHNLTRNGRLTHRRRSCHTESLGEGNFNLNIVNWAGGLDLLWILDNQCKSLCCDLLTSCLRWQNSIGCWTLEFLKCQGDRPPFPEKFEYLNSLGHRLTDEQWREEEEIFRRKLCYQDRVGGVEYGRWVAEACITDCCSTIPVQAHLHMYLFADL